MKKIDLAKENFQKSINIYRCPICHSDMYVENNSIKCIKNHCFDISKQGYINLLKHTNKSNESKYYKQMFLSRKIVTEAGFFNIIIKEVTKYLKNNEKYKLKIIDVGTGEGSQLNKISMLLKDNEYIGVDISKEGIKLAARNYRNIDWVIGDIANIPVKDKKIDYVINILSPANYSEFKRILKDDGKLIKVIPCKEYLKEIRELYGIKREYSNECIKENLEKKVKIIEQKHINDKISIDEKYILDLFNMTPLIWNNRKINIPKKSMEITLDYEIIIGELR